MPGVVVRKKHAAPCRHAYPPPPTFTSGGWAHIVELQSSVSDTWCVDRIVGVSRRRSVTVNVAPPSGLLCALMVLPCASTIVRTIVRPIPRPCAFVVTNGVNNVPLELRGQTGAVVAHGDFDICRPHVAADPEMTPGRRRLEHRVHCIHHEVHEHLLQEHRIAAHDALTRRPIDRDLDFPCGHVVGDEGQALVDHGMQIDLALIQLATAEHRPKVIDDPCGVNALGLDIGQDLLNRAWRRAIGGDHHL